LTLRQLHETLTKDYGVKISLSTLSEYAKKGIIKPDYSTSDKLLYLKVRVPGIADLLKTIKTNPQLLTEQQLSQQPIVVPLKQDQEQPEQPPLDITKMTVTEQILTRLTVLEKQYQDQQLEIHKIKLQIADLETKLSNKIDDLERDYVDDYNELREDYNELTEIVNENAEACRKLQDNVNEVLEKLGLEINQIRAVINRLVGGDRHL
jgi:DNA repair ATPase RecN